MIKKIIDKLFLEKEIKIKESEVVQFRRWKLFSCPWFGIYIHKIYICDNDIHPHNHPWKFTSIVLGGEYQETSKTEKLSDVRKFGSIYTLDTDEYHKIYVTTPSTVLIIRGRVKHDSWGYWSESGYIDWESYRKMYDIKIEKGET